METLLLDPADAATRVEFGMVEAEFSQHAQWRAAAAVFAAVEVVLREAAQHPEVFVDAQMLRGDGIELATRAAVADLAVRLSLSEGTVRDHAHVAGTLRRRMPVLWSWFCEGEVSTQNAREAAALVAELPQQFWAAFDEALLDIARTMTHARFRVRARAVREKLHTTTSTQRHETAVQQRRVWKEADRDGMAWFGAYLPAETVQLAMTRVDGLAFQLFRQADETRTMAQLRADVLGDLLLGGGPGSAPGISLALSIPVLSLLGDSDLPAVLEGVGPIDLDTARRLAATAPSITRLLTDPVTGAVLQLDPHQYRTTKAMKRWFALTQPTCDFPGCARPTTQCDLDHTTAWAAGGTTTVHNLAPRCRSHHTLKHQTRWSVHTPPGETRPVWTSPTGHHRHTDPPPF